MALGVRGHHLYRNGLPEPGGVLGLTGFTVLNFAKSHRH